MLKHFLTALLITGTASAATINIPDDIATIQGGIEATAVGDTILVAPGTYVETIDFLGKDIVVGSHYLTTGDTTYVTQTVIDADSLGHVVRFDKGETQNAMLAGLTITGGATYYEEQNGGGIYISNSSPLVDHCTITNNRAVVAGSEDVLGRVSTLGEGGGIYASGGSPIICDTLIYDNYAGYSPGGSFGTNERIKLERVTIGRNYPKCLSGTITECNLNLENISIRNVDLIDCSTAPPPTS